MKHSETYYADPPFPRDLGGRRRPDRFWTALNRITPAVERLTRLIGPPRSTPPATTLDRRVVVTRVEHPAREVAALHLTAADGRPLPPWDPGCHVDVVLPSGTMRQYSLTGDPADTGSYRIAVRRLPGGRGSGEVHELPPGRELTVRGPRNAFPFARLPSYVFLAGGIGITPILPMVHAAERAGADYRLVYTGRFRATMPFLDELPAPRGGGSIEVRTDDTHGVGDPAALLGTPPEGTAVYCCGPPPLLEGVRAALEERPGVGFHWERFSAPPVRDGVPFEVELARTGRVLQVPADRTVLETIQRVLPDVAYSCRQGFCNTCRVPLLAGEVEHRGSPTGGGPVSEGTVAICVSRSRGGRLVLDL
ncbi:ferredoxin-NADP reductase [Haloactinospora alba]|uniref:Ferredoxin-NADP reductase n=1 Tax=Haloactinospora alba TaxID=405555 RepID=A0A543NL65_9ACTN|nr:PDR/VanB family oxidoreductase [Haloactinospora alba]TQN32559.1 ferredoxin-NADP reductase [Haloactinospora alba]